MKRILLVRISAFGDQIHCAPVAADIRRRWPDCTIDWAVDERFADVPRRHAEVDRVVALPLKRLQADGLRRAAARAALWGALRLLRERRYDAALDAHGVWKSALVTRLARADLRIGLAARHCGEAQAAHLYDRRIELDTRLAAASRLRALAAAALGTDATLPIDYRLRWDDPPIDECPGSDQPFAVLAHATSKADKLWPEPAWIALGRRLAARDLRVLLPWGSPDERSRSRRLRDAIGHAAIVPAHAPIGRWAATLARARFAAGVDTGLTHLAGCVGTPTLAIFCATSAGHFAPIGTVSRSIGGADGPPSLHAAIQAADAMLEAAAEGIPASVSAVFGLPRGSVVRSR